MALNKPDVHFAVSTRPLSNGGIKPVVAIGTPSSDNAVHAKIYSNIDDIANDFQENTSAYAVAESVFSADNYNAPVEIIQYPKEAKANASETSAKISFKSGVQQAFYEHLSDGWDYVVLSDYDSSVAKDLSDLLYDNQRGFFVYQVDSVQALNDLSSKVKSYQSNRDGKLGNMMCVVETDDDNQVAGQIAGYLAGNAPVDAQQIGNQSNFKPDENLSVNDLETIVNANGTTVVNKADDYMMLSGRALAGNYADQFIKTRHSIDAIQYALQKKHNSEKNPKFDDDTIREYQQTVLSVGNQLLSEGYLDEAPKVYTTPRADIPDSEIESRQYNHLTVELSIANTIDTINGKFNVTF